MNIDYRELKVFLFQKDNSNNNNNMENREIKYTLLYKCGLKYNNTYLTG